ncbi:unnamed protein product [Nyctereutes procyonoides]|uniref:(raccoon dog) hypothetical protein n=1 Tax=Nyctereutes procyonoides TaxID=34880 RepID=A0A811YSM5_NYCPR|nr:unnamed protein product [Nyctereutes procyonoides]
MLTGSGPYYDDVGLQLDFPEVAYTQINSCSLSAWKKLPATNTRSQELSKIRKDEEAPRWVPAKFVRDIKTEKEDESAELMPSSEEEDS